MSQKPQSSSNETNFSFAAAVLAAINNTPGPVDSGGGGTVSYLSGIPSGILYDILSGIPSGILSGKHSGTLSGISSGILSGILSGVLSGISPGILSGR